MGDGLYLSYFEVSRPLNRVLHEWAKVAHDPPLELAAALQLKGPTSHLKPDFDSVGYPANGSSSSTARASSNRPGSASHSCPDSSSGWRPSSAIRRTTSAIHTFYTDATAVSSASQSPAAVSSASQSPAAGSSASQSPAVVPPLSTLPPRPPTPTSPNSAASAPCTQLAPTPRMQLWGSSPRAWRAQLMERQAADDRDEISNPFTAHHYTPRTAAHHHAASTPREGEGAASEDAWAQYGTCMRAAWSERSVWCSL
jgi:hypothetical protein